MNRPNPKQPHQSRLFVATAMARHQTQQANELLQEQQSYGSRTVGGCRGLRILADFEPAIIGVTLDRLKMSGVVVSTNLDAETQSDSTCPLPRRGRGRNADDADSTSARDIHDPTTDAGYMTAGASPKAKLSAGLLLLEGSPYMPG